jgi:NADH:ubiquinone oxidoreductase subunit 6 (subunit J)
MPRPSLAFAFVNAFHVCGALFVVWAVLVSFLGIKREDFPGSGAGGRVVGAISVILAAAAIGTAIYTSASEEEEEHEGGEGAALVR